MTPAAEAATTAPMATTFPSMLNQPRDLAEGSVWGGTVLGEGPRGPKRRSVVGVLACWADHIVVGRLQVSSSPLTLPPYLHVRTTLAGAFLGVEQAALLDLYRPGLEASGDTGLEYVHTYALLIPVQLCKSLCQLMPLHAAT